MLFSNRMTSTCFVASRKSAVIFVRKLCDKFISCSSFKCAIMLASIADNVLFDKLSSLRFVCDFKKSKNNELNGKKLLSHFNIKSF